jgi:hypothetical protein
MIAQTLGLSKSQTNCKESMADLEPGIKLSSSTTEAMSRVSVAPPTVELRQPTSSPPVTMDTVGDYYYFTDAFARNAVKAGISQQELIRLLLKEYADLQETLVRTLKERPPQYLPSLQACATMTPSTTPETSIG